MLFCIKITFFHTHLQINYYSDKHHDNCTVITKYAKIVLLSLDTTKNTHAYTTVKTISARNSLTRQGRHLSWHMPACAQALCPSATAWPLFQLALWTATIFGFMFLNWRKPLFVNQFTRSWMTPRIQKTPAFTCASTAHAGWRVLRTVPHYRQNLDTVCAGEGVRAQLLIYSQQATNHFLQTLSRIQGLFREFGAPHHCKYYAVNLTIYSP